MKHWSQRKKSGAYRRQNNPSRTSLWRRSEEGTDEDGGEQRSSEEAEEEDNPDPERIDTSETQQSEH